MSFSIEQEQRLDGEIKFRVPEETENQYRYLRERKFKIQDPLRDYAIKRIAEIYALVKSQEKQHDQVSET
jgi:hypothetical protein